MIYEEVYLAVIGLISSVCRFQDGIHKNEPGWVSQGRMFKALKQKEDINQAKLDWQVISE